MAFAVGAAHLMKREFSENVGSTLIAKYARERGTAIGKPVQALGSAETHAVIMPDANLEMTANALMAAACGSVG